MEFKNPYFSDKERIELLQYWLLVQSYVYYELNENIVSDANFNANILQLKYLSQKYDEEFKKSKYYDYFKNVEGSTMFNIFSIVEENDKKLMERIKRDAAYAVEHKCKHDV